MLLFQIAFILEYLVARKLHNWTYWIYWTPESDPFTNVSGSNQHAYGAWCYTPVAMEVIGSPEFSDLEGWMDTFGHKVYIFILLFIFILNFQSVDLLHLLHCNLRSSWNWNFNTWWIEWNCVTWPGNCLRVRCLIHCLLTYQQVKQVVY